MPRIIRFHFWPPLSSRSEEYWKAKVQELAGDLFSQDAIDDKLRRATRYAEGFDRSEGWKTWMWLINTHRTARRQVSLLNKCASRLAQLESINMQNHKSRDLLEWFEDAFGRVKNRKALLRRVSNTRKRWLKLQERIEEVRLPVAFANVLLMLRTRSGIETTSLLIGGLIAAGAVYMSYFVETAVGISAYKYWTTEDLVVQGLRMAPWIVILLLVFEAVFLLLRFLLSRRSRYLVYGWISKFHLSSVLLFFLLLTVVVSLRGHAKGLDSFEKFSRMNENSAQMATVLDNSVLNDVYLVATSARTAIFLCADVPTKNGKKRYANWQNKMTLFAARREKGYWATTVHVLFPYSDKKRESAPTQSPSKLPERPFNMVVMDRALIVCHARKCPLPPASAGNVQNTRIINYIGTGRRPAAPAGRE